MNKILIGAVAGVALAGTGAAAYGTLGGGGAQPEDVIPATALAYVDVDLDPSAEQKLDALRFVRKFPKAPDEVKRDDVDFGEVLVKQAQKEGQLTNLNYETDIKPWLGKRFAVAVVPEGNEFVPLVALATTDADKAKAAVAKLDATKSYCNVGADYVVCGGKQATVDGAVKSAKDASLAKAKNFASDMDGVGNPGIATMWLDTEAAVRAGIAKAKVSASASASSAQLDDLAAKAKGRVAAALRFDGTALELAARSFDTAKVEGKNGDTGVNELPTGTLAAFGLANGGETVSKSWAEAAKEGGTELTKMTEQLRTQFGVRLPEDLSALLGSKFAVAFGGVDEAGGMPQVALVSNGDHARIQALTSTLGNQLSSATSSSSGTSPLRVSGDSGRTIVALDDTYAAQVASGSGLGSSAVFSAAVPDAGKAQFVAIADIAGLVAKFGSTMDAETKANVAPLSAVGMSASTEESGQRFLLRLTTK